jgi:hypothetical protein
LNNEELGHLQAGYAKCKCTPDSGTRRADSSKQQFAIISAVDTRSIFFKEFQAWQKFSLRALWICLKMVLGSFSKV